MLKLFVGFVFVVGLFAGGLVTVSDAEAVTRLEEGFAVWCEKCWTGVRSSRE